MHNIPTCIFSQVFKEKMKSYWKQISHKIYCHDVLFWFHFKGIISFEYKKTFTQIKKLTLWKSQKWAKYLLSGDLSHKAEFHHIHVNYWSQVNSCFTFYMHKVKMLKINLIFHRKSIKLVWLQNDCNLSMFY